MASTRSTPAPVGRVTIRRDTPASSSDSEKAAEILRDGFWHCKSPVLRFRAHNDSQALLELMRSRVNVAAPKGGLILAYRCAEAGTQEQEMGSGSVQASGAEAGAGDDLVGAMIVSLPGEGFTQLQKNYGDRKEQPASSSAAVPVDPQETEAERKTRIWVETDLVPWFGDFAARSYGPGIMDKSLYISLFAMRQDVQGLGLGREVMEQVMAWGDGEGWEMTLADHEPELVKFYSSFGFQEVGKEVRDCDGTDVTWWAMKRPARP